ALGGELVDVRADMPSMRRHPVPLGVLIGCLHGLQISAEGDLGVDDHQLAIGESNDQVWSLHAVPIGGAVLLGEVDVAQHAGGLDDATQLHLYPASPDVRF